MLSKNHIKSRPVKKVGFFCYRCGRDDFGLNQKSLSAHVRFCSFDQYSTSLTKRKSDHLSSSLHSSGSSPYPLLVKKTRSLNNNTINTANSYLNTSRDNNVDFTAEEGCADGYLEDYDLPFQDTNIEIHTDTSLLDTVFIGTNVINHSIIPSTEDSAIPYDPNCVMPLSYCFQLDLIHALSKHRINLNVHDEIIQVIKKHSSDSKLNFSSYNLLNRTPFLTKIERDLSSKILKPKDILVNLNGGRQASVAVFNLEAILDCVMTLSYLVLLNAPNHHGVCSKTPLLLVSSKTLQVIGLPSPVSGDNEMILRDDMSDTYVRVMKQQTICLCISDFGPKGITYCSQLSVEGPC